MSAGQHFIVCTYCGRPAAPCALPSCYWLHDHKERRAACLGCLRKMGRELHRIARATVAGVEQLAAGVGLDLSTTAPQTEPEPPPSDSGIVKSS